MDVIDVNDNEIIEGDEDTQEQDLYDGCLYPYDVNPEEIDVREDKLSVFEFLRKLKKGQIIVDPEFQRNLVWKEEQQCRFIESIILSIPLPPLYVNQDINGNYIIIDGRQRTLTLRNFMPDKGEGFKLKDLKALPRLNGLCFSNLSSDIQTTIEDKQLTLYIIKPSVPIEVVYDIFNRINTGGTQLNRQEIRNCLYKGKAMKLLKELSEQEYFKKAIDNGISPNRMKDREAILRYLAFKIMDFKAFFKLTEQSYKQLKADGLPENSLIQLKKLQNQPFADEKKFLEAIEKEIGTAETVKFRSSILKNAFEMDFEAFFKLTEQSYEKLKTDGLPENSLIQLKKLQNQPFADEKKFLEAIEKEIGTAETVKFRSSILKSAFEKDYKNEMDSFLGKALEKLNKMNNSELDELKEDFERVMKLTYDFFGNKNFRIYTNSGRGRVNTAVMESISFFFSNHDDDFLQKNRKKILRNYKLLLQDIKYLDAVKLSTGDTTRVKNRFSIVQKILGNV